MVSIAAAAWVARVDFTLAYTRMSGRDNRASLALVMGWRFWKTVIAAGGEVRGEHRSGGAGIREVVQPSTYQAHVFHS